MLFCCLGPLSHLLAQDKIDKYCLLINETTVKAVREQNTFKLFLGYENSLMAFKDTALLAQLKQVEKRANLVDAFNYLASLGWQYIGLTASMNSRTSFANTNLSQQYLFKRTFDRSALK
ncbi:hypothetical protein GO755_27085 [Spirosoma sp. HMF4905]|uniref:Uncharacterized protein n=2 Tax=Spirosoma arboris TaxID=2682092 RepID=A0A7K1SIV8_9BACT|nr:hypothetical protein [Spirosoma arboris]